MLEHAVALGLIVKGVKWVSGGTGCRGVYYLVGSSRWGLQHQQLLDSCQQELHGFLQGSRTAGILNGASRFCVVGTGRLQGWLEPVVCMHSAAGVAVVPVWWQG